MGSATAFVMQESMHVIWQNVSLSYIVGNVGSRFWKNKNAWNTEVWNVAELLNKKRDDWEITEDPMCNQRKWE